MSENSTNSAHSFGDLEHITKEEKKDPFFYAYVLLALILVTLGVAWGAKTLGYINADNPRMVVIDPVRITNAQRAYISSIVHTKNSRSSSDLIDAFSVSKKVTEVIKNVSKGRIVLVKQAVLAGDLPDITDSVLKAAGLPLNVPTIDISQQIEMAPVGSPLYIGSKKERGSK